MCVYGVQKRIARHAVRTARGAVRGEPLKACAVVRSTVAANAITARVTYVRVVNPKLGMIEDVERLRTKFKHATFPYDEMLEHAHVEIDSMRVV